MDPKTAKLRANYDCDTSSMVAFFCGANASLKRAAIDKTGKFDVGYKRNALYEELDYAVRLRHTGAKIFYEPAADTTHLREEQGGCREDKARAYYFFKFYNTSYFYVKNLFHGNPLPFLRAMKNEIEFYTRKAKGHALADAALYFAAIKLGALRGALKRFLFI